MVRGMLRPMAYVVVPLTPEAEARLRELARRELRPARLQAARLVLDGLRRAGLDPDAPDDPERRPDLADAERQTEP